jgi:hypothetical protein
MLKAQGLSYNEIGESLGWTYTKVNRCITEGRARFLKVYAEIEAGAACERFAPTLAALVGGTATADALLELRPHIRNCPSCRATVRELHATRLGRLAALWPIPVLLSPLRWVSGRFGDAGDGPGAPVAENAVTDPGHIPDVHDALRGIELPEPSMAGGTERLVELKAHLYAWWHRLQGTDVATSAQLAAGAGGGGRVATIGAIVGLCLSSLGAGTVCVVTGVVDNPFLPKPEERRVVVRQRPTPPTTPTPEPRRPERAARAMPSLQPAKPPAVTTERPPPRSSAARPGRPRNHLRPAPAPAPAGATRDFAFEQAAPATQPVPAQAPANGGGEFAP